MDVSHGLINYRDTTAKAKMSPKKFTCRETLRQVFICLSLHLGFCFRWGGGGSSTFVGSESGQIQSVKVLNSCRIWSPTELNIPTPSQPLTAVCVYCTVIRGRGRGGTVEPEKRLEGQQLQSWVENINITDCLTLCLKCFPQLVEERSRS